MLIVQKYGGTSVETPERIRKVAERIKQSIQDSNRLIVVVSAMGHTTDELLKLADQVSSSPPLREMDMLLSVGERISMSLLSMALSDLGVDAVSFTGSQSGIITDHSHRRAQILRIKSDRVQQVLDQRKVAIVAGFQGVSEQKEITTLGRGGSDTTAVALAAHFRAERCEIYTDVDGVYSADPRLSIKPVLYRKLNYDIVQEMARLGAQVLHPRSVALAQKYKVPLFVLSSLSFENSKGTQIMEKTEESMESYKVYSVTQSRDYALLTIELMRPTVLGTVWNEIRKHHWSVLTPVVQESQVSFFIEREAIAEWKKTLSALSVDGFVKSFECFENRVPVSVIGEGFPQDQSVLNEAVEVLAAEADQIQVFRVTAASQSVTVAVKDERSADAVKVLHEHFLE